MLCPVVKLCFANCLFSVSASALLLFFFHAQVCSNEHEVTAWFLGLQAQAPQTVYYMSRGMILWQRLIMKLNYYSLDQIKRVFAKREAAAKAAAAAAANSNANHSNPAKSPSAHK